MEAEGGYHPQQENLQGKKEEQTAQHPLAEKKSGFRGFFNKLRPKSRRSVTLATAGAIAVGGVGYAIHEGTHSSDEKPTTITQVDTTQTPEAETAGTLTIEQPITHPGEIDASFQRFRESLSEISNVDTIQSSTLKELVPHYLANALIKDGGKYGEKKQYWFGETNFSDEPDIEINNENTQIGHKINMEYYVNADGQLIAQKDAKLLTPEQQRAYGDKFFGISENWKQENDMRLLHEENKDFTRGIAIGSSGKVVATIEETHPDTQMNTELPTMIGETDNVVRVGQLSEQAIKANFVPLHTETNYKKVKEYINKLGEVTNEITETPIKAEANTIKDATVAGVMMNVLKTNDDPEREIKMRELRTEMTTKSKVDTIMAYSALKNIGTDKGQGYVDMITDPTLKADIQKKIDSKTDNVQLRIQRKELWDTATADVQNGILKSYDIMKDNYEKGATSIANSGDEVISSQNVQEEDLTM